MKKTNNQPAIGKIIEKRYPNLSLVESDNKIYCLKGGITGQQVRFKKKKKKLSGYPGAILLEVLEKSPVETNPTCPAVDICGGCSYQSISYEQESSLKNDQLHLLFSNIMEKTGVELAYEAAVDEHAYRSKMEYTFGDFEFGGKAYLGLNQKNRNYEVVDTSGCTIVADDFERIRKAVEDYVQSTTHTAYNFMKRTGFLRHLLVYQSYYNKQIMICLITTSQDELNTTAFLESILHATKEYQVSSVYHLINDNFANAVGAEKSIHIYGEKRIEEKILGNSFSIEPLCFMQPNVKLYDRFYEKMTEVFDKKSFHCIVDLYCGVGTTTLALAPYAKKVIGIELNEASIEQAKLNAKRNNITNVEFIHGDAGDEFFVKPDLLVVDPPRIGLRPNVMEKIKKLEPNQLVYISCNPKTQVRDLKILMGIGYSLEKLQALDQFPRTYHVETIALLCRKN